MPIILLLRIILETAVSDIQTAELIEKFKKNNTLFNSFLKNPAGILKNQLMSKVLGQGKSQKELSEFQQVLQKLTNLPVIHKKIMTHITNNNIAKLQHIQKQYLNGKSLMDKGKEIIMNSLTQEDYDSMIGVYVNLSSSALAGGIWTPIIQQQSGTYGIASLTFRTSNKSYDYFMVTRETWIDMCKATGAYKQGAFSVFMREYYHGGLDKKLEDTKSQFPIAFQINAVSKEIPNLETKDKTIAGAINEIKNKQSSSSNWKDVAFSQDRETIIYELKTNTHYKIFYDVNNKRSTGLIGKYPCLISEFYWIYTDGSSFNDLWINLPHWKDTNLSHLVIVINQHKISWKNNSNDGNFWKLQELQE